jgi:microcystin-dependent protein
MADEIISISELDKGTTFVGDEQFVINQTNPVDGKVETRYATADQLFDYIKNIIYNDFDKIVPVGCIKTYAAPLDSNISLDGWLLCDGSYVPSTGKYNNLYKKIKDVYGPVKSDTFKLPDLRGRVIMGYCTSSNQYTPNFGNWNKSNSLKLGYGNYPGTDFGEFRHKITEEEMPRHTHADTGHTHNYLDVTKFDYVYSQYHSADQPRPSSSDVPNFQSIKDEIANRAKKPPKINEAFNTNTLPANVDVSLVGNSEYHNNMQPYLALNYLIKY